MKNVLVLIPARYESSRFPGKPLVKVQGKTLIEHVYDNFAATFETCVVTNNEEIAGVINQQNGKVLMVNDEVRTGTERVWLAYERFYKKHKNEIKLIILVQGDEPLLKAHDVLPLAKQHLSENRLMSTFVRQRSFKDHWKDYKNPNIVKAIWSENTNVCSYFSRSPIPFCRQENAEKTSLKWHQHIGVYLFHPSLLESLYKTPQDSLEMEESLEQLRTLQLGVPIHAMQINKNLIGIDTPEDLNEWKRSLRNESV